MHKKINYVLLTIASVSVFFIILISSLFSYVYKTSYYDKEFNKYGIYNLFEKEIAMNETKNMLGFLQYKEELDMDFFNAQEKSHLQEVRQILSNIFLVYYMCLFLFWGILLFYFLLKKKELMWFFSRLIFYSGMLSLIIILLFGIIYFLFGFDSLFLKFHELFFTGNYSFDPAVSNMKALLPDEFFSDMVNSIGLVIMIKVILLSITGYLFLRKK